MNVTEALRVLTTNFPATLHGTWMDTGLLLKTLQRGGSPRLEKSEIPPDLRGSSNSVAPLQSRLDDFVDFIKLMDRDTAFKLSRSTIYIIG